MTTTDWVNLVPAIASDPAIPFPNWTRIAAVVRSENGAASFCAFCWDESGRGAYFVLDDQDGDVFDWMWEVSEDCDARVVIVIDLDRDRDAATLSLVRGADADPWFVPLGREDDLLGLAADLKPDAVSALRCH